MLSATKEILLKLASKIKGKKSSIAEELEKISKEKKQRILTTEVSKYRGKESTFTLLTHAIFCENSQAVKDILRQAELSNLLKSVFSAKIISDNSLIYTPLTYAILCKNSKAIEEILKVSKENGILKDIFNATITIKYQDSEEKICTPPTDTISCQSNEVFNITRAINQDGQEKTHIPFPTLDKRETELKLKLREKRQKRQSRRDEGLNFNNGSSDKNVEIKVNRDISLQNSSGTENEINHTAVRNDVGVVKLPIESRVNVKAQNINATIVTFMLLKTVVTSVALELRAGKIACVLSKPPAKLKEVAITDFQGLALY